MKHLKNNLLCVIDVETTPHEIWQIAAIPLNPAFRPLEGCRHFEVVIRPEFPEKCDRQIMRMKKHELEHIKKARETHDTAVDLFHKYCTEIIDKYAGREAKILPVGQNWAFDCGKLQMWLGDEVFADLFHPWYRDPMVIAQFLNDVAFLDVEGTFKEPPFLYANLNYLTKKYRVVNHKAHDALQDAQATFKVYEAMVKACVADFPRAEGAAVLFKWLFELVNKRSGRCLKTRSVG
jgi:DNA polymerase III epsilon subunit-like protein